MAAVIVHLATKSIERMSFNSLLQTKLVLTMTEDIIIQSEPEKQDKNQILQKKF